MAVTTTSQATTKSVDDDNWRRREQLAVLLLLLQRRRLLITRSVRLKTAVQWARCRVKHILMMMGTWTRYVWDTRTDGQSAWSIHHRRQINVSLCTRAGHERFESIQQSQSNRIAVEFDLSSRLQSRCQQCLPVANKTAANRAVL